MATARLRSNSLVKLLLVFVMTSVGIAVESRGPVVSKLVFLGLPLLLAWFSASQHPIRVLHFIMFFEVLLVSVFWPVSFLSKSLIVTTLYWYLAEFPQRALANLAVAILILVITIVSAPVTQQF